MNDLNLLLQKAESGQALSAEEMARLDALLDASHPVAQVVETLPVEEPNMVWRSQLNERLHQIAPKHAKPRFQWRLAIPGAVAGAILAGYLLVPRTPNLPAGSVMASAPSLESSMVSAHSESVALADVSAVSNPIPAEAPASSSEVIQWTPNDLESL